MLIQNMVPSCHHRHSVLVLETPSVLIMTFTHLEFTGNRDRHSTAALRPRVS